MERLIEYLDKKPKEVRIPKEIRKCPRCDEPLESTHCSKCDREQKEQLWDWSQPM